MRTVPARGMGAQLLTVLLLMLAGPALALRLAVWLTPEATTVQVLAPFAFGLVFFVGAVIWMGVGVLTTIVTVLWSLVRLRNPWEGQRHDGRQLVPRGYGVYLVLGFLAGLVLGSIAGLLTEMSLVGALAVWIGAGGGYGAVLRSAAHTGYLPFPEPE